MSEIKWIKITTTMFDDEKIDFIESLPEADSILIIWIKLLTLAGKCNAGGYIFLTENIPYTDEMLAHKFRRSLNIVRLALETFQRLKMIFLDEHGIKIANWEKHQNVEGMERVRAQTRQRVAKHREKTLLLSNATCNVTVTHGNAIDIDKEIDIDIEKEINNNTSASLPSLSEQSKQIFDHYVNTFNGFFPRGIKLTNDRKKKIEARLKEGYTVEQINLAITNIRTSEFHCGKNDRNTFYADLSFVCRNGSTLEKWMNHKGGNGHDPTPTDDDWAALERAGF